MAAIAKAGVYISVVGDADQSVKAFAAARDELDKLARQADDSGGRFDKFSAKMGSAGKAVAVAVAVAGAGLLKVGSDFDDAFDTIRLQTGATGDALEGLQDDFRQVVAKVPTDFASAGEAIAGLNQRLGLTGKPLQDVSAQVLELSRLTGTDLESTVAGVTRVMGDWGKTTAEVPATLDALFRAGQATGIGVDALSEKVVQFGAPLRQMGFSFEETAAMLGKFEKEGVNGELVMGSMRKALATLAKAGEDAPTAFVRISDEIKAMKNPTEATLKAIELFGAKAGPDMAAAIREGRFELGSLLDTVTGGKETILGASADTADFAEKWQMLKNRVFLALEPIATRVFDSIGRGMDRLGPIFTDTGQVIGTVVETVQNVWETFVGLFSGGSDEAGGSASRLGDTISGVGEMFASVFGAAQAVVETWVAVISDLWDRFGKDLVEHLQRGFDAIMQVLNGAVQVITGVFELVKAILTGKWGEAWDAVKQILGGAWDAILGVIKAAINGISAIIGGAMAGISAAWSLVWNSVKTVFGDLWSGIWGTITGAFDKVVGLIGGLPGRLASAASGLWDFFYNGFKAAYNKVAEFIRGLDFTINVPDILPGPDKYSIGFPDLPLLADGGRIARAGMAIVGERGPEIRYMPEGAEVIPLDRAGPASAGGLVVYQTVTALDPQEAARISSAEWSWLDKTSGW